nr:U32 family peptidase [Tissierella sp.]
MAIMYGADAVYLGGEAFGLRTSSKNFSLEEIKEGVEYAHKRGKAVYITLNIVPHDEDLVDVEEYVKALHAIEVDAVIVSDPGMFAIVKRTVPDIEIHISTQASVTNYETMMFWYSLGVRRIVLARELSFEEIENITKKIPDDLEIEAFVHGSMCMSYSGRCLMSNYMTDRDANRGDCSQPCRFKYHVVEEKRPGEYFPVIENDEGSFIFNSKDLCMIEYIDRLVKCGINSFKIEGRVKSSYYVATIIRAYRIAIDEYEKDPENYEYNPKWLDEVKKVSHRAFTTGFYLDRSPKDAQVYSTSSYVRDFDFVGMVLDYDKSTGIATIEQRNRMFVGDEIEVFGPEKEFNTQIIKEMWNSKDEAIEVAPHAQQIITMKMEKDTDKYYLIRKRRED